MKTITFIGNGNMALSIAKGLKENYKIEVEYDPRFTTLFPRMYSADNKHINEYKIVVNKSTVPVGTADLVKKIVKENQQNKIEYTVNVRHSHQGHLGFDISHKRFAESILKDLDINEDEVKRGFESLVVSLAAQMSLNKGKIVSRKEILASV